MTESVAMVDDRILKSGGISMGSMGRCLVAAIALTTMALGCDDEPGAELPDVETPDTGGMLGDSEVVVDMAPAVDMAPDMAPDMMRVEADMGAEGPPCDERANLGFEADPVAILDDKAFAPRAVFTGEAYGLVFQTENADGPNTVWFQRFDRDGNALSDPAALGVAEVPQHDVAFDGTNYIVAWLAVRTEQTVFDGILLKVIDGNGMPSAAPAIEVPSTFDAEQLAFSWTRLGGGMLLYNRGRSGEAGIYANALDPAFTVGPQVQLTQSPAQSPATIFGDGAWGAAWLARDGAEPGELAFVLLNDQAQALTEERRVQGGGIGSVHMSYGQGIYGVGWTKLFGPGRPQAAMTLVDGGGDPFATPPLAGPEGVATITDVAFVAPDRFAIAWQENRPSGTRIGLSRLTTQGLMTDPVLLEPPEGSARLGMTVGGTSTRMGAWFTEDPEPTPLGFSDGARVMGANLGPCD